MPISIQELAKNGCPCGCGSTIANEGIKLKVQARLALTHTFTCREGYTGYWSGEGAEKGGMMDAVEPKAT
jgi:hypothetical protein